ncbi:hypothetical protein V6N13_076797 [Hibiscus sabdariffa]|uniref:Uncharacterized protein n=2 Tax=Hibiscus sabdariffa TaxID=183260 RepID=A0ABR2NHF7_9ROSI
MSDKGKGIAKDDAEEARQTRSRYGVAGSSRSRYNLREGSTWIRERRDPSTAIDREQQEEEDRRLMPPPPPPPPPRTPPTRLMPSVPRPRPSSLRRIRIKFRTPGPSKTEVMSLPEAPGPVQLKGKGALKSMQQMLTKALLIGPDFSGSSSTSAPTPSPALSPQPSSSSGTSHFPSQLSIFGQLLRHFHHLFEDPPRRRYRLVKITELENIEDDNEEKVATPAGGINIRDPQPPSGEGATSAGGINIRDPQQPSGEGATSAGGINIRDPQPPSREGATSAGGINIREPQPPSGETNSDKSTEAGRGNDGSSCKETD